MSDPLWAACISGFFTFLTAAITTWGAVYIAKLNMDKKHEEHRAKDDLEQGRTTSGNTKGAPRTLAERPDHD